MSNQQIKHPATGKMQDADIVEIVEIIEKPMKVKLEDGSILRIKVDVIEVARFKGPNGPDGHPIYSVKSGTMVAVVESK